MSSEFLSLCVMWLAYFYGKAYLYEVVSHSEKGQSLWESLTLRSARVVSGEWKGVRRRTKPFHENGYDSCTTRWVGHPSDYPLQMRNDHKGSRAKRKRPT
jgi:hypothetical protein